MKQKIRILRIVNRFNLGGPTFNATFLTKYLPEEYETMLIGGVHDEGETDSLHILKEYGIEPILLPEIQRSIHFKKDRLALKKIKEIIQAFKPDIVHTHASKAGFLGRYAAIQLNVPVVVHTFHGHVFHSYFGKIKTQIFIQIERYLAKRSTGIIAISKQQKYELSEVYNIASASKIKVVPLGFDLDKFKENKEERREEVRNEYGIQEDEVAVAIVGRLAQVKDHDYFLKVAESILQRTSRKVKFFIVGGGSEQENIASKVEEINKTLKTPQIFMTSWVLDIARFNQGMDIIGLTSKNEGTPVSIIEALASKVAVISTDVGGIKDIVADGKSGFVVKRESQEEYIEKLQKLIEDKALRESFANFGEKEVFKKFGYIRLVNDMYKYYKELLQHEQ